MKSELNGTIPTFQVFFLRLEAWEDSTPSLQGIGSKLQGIIISSAIKRYFSNLSGQQLLAGIHMIRQMDLTDHCLL